MTYNVFSGTLNPTHFTCLKLTNVRWLFLPPYIYLGMLVNAVLVLFSTSDIEFILTYNLFQYAMAIN